MRAVLVVAVVAGCGGDTGGGDVDAGAPGADGASGIDGALAPDAGPAADAAVQPDADYPPSPANPGWIGGACADPGACADVADALCLRDGFPNGMCSRECDGLCPDRGEPTDAVTVCVDGRPYGFDRGLCAARCDVDLLPPTGCPAGYRCAPRHRYTDPTVVIDSCVPLAPRRPCPGGTDEIVFIDYPDRGALWIPAEAQCGGAFDLLVHLHGINPSSTERPWLGGGRYIEILIRSLIDTGVIAPIVVAAPVHFQGSSTQLFGAEFDLHTHLDLVEAELTARGISIASLSYAGHSGAGCDADNGLYEVLAARDTLIPARAPRMPLWGLEDICYESSYHWEAPIAALTGTDTAIVNVYSVQGDPTAFEANLLPDAVDMACADSLYTRCIRDPVRPWCSYRTRSSAGINHSNNPYFFAREVLPQLFPGAGSATPCVPP